MIFTVIWRPALEDKLADIWIRAPDRQAVADAANLIDPTLRNSPENRGQDYYGDRLLYLPPLYVVYRVIPDDCIVKVLDIWHD